MMRSCKSTSYSGSGKSKRQVSIVLPDADKSETESAFEDHDITEGNDAENSATENEAHLTESGEVNSDKESGHCSKYSEGDRNENKEVDDTNEMKKETVDENSISKNDKGTNKQKREKDKLTKFKKKSSKGSGKTNKENAKKVKGADKKTETKTDRKNKSAKKRMTDKPKTAENCTQYDPDDCKHEDTENLVADEDCRKLNEAMHAKKTNKEVINEIISELSDKEREATRETYRNRYDRDIIDDVKHELKGPHLLLVQSLLKDQSQTDAEHFYNAVSGFGTDEDLLVYLLISRNAQEVADMKKQYVKLYGREMATDVTNETSGWFRKLCLQLVNKVEPDGAHSEDDIKIAEQHVQKLWKPGEKFDQGNNNDVLIEVMSQCSSTQYRMICNLYMKESGVSFPEAIARSTKGAFQETLLSLASYFASPADYHAQNVARAFKGFRNNDRLLISTILPNLQTNTGAVQDSYLRRYNTSLEDAIRSNCGSGDYGKLWLKLIARKDKHENENKTDTNLN